MRNGLYEQCNTIQRDQTNLTAQRTSLTRLTNLILPPLGGTFIKVRYTQALLFVVFTQIPCLFTMDRVVEMPLTAAVPEVWLNGENLQLDDILPRIVGKISSNGEYCSHSTGVTGLIALHVLLSSLQ